VPQRRGGGVVGSQGWENAVVVAAQALAERERAQGDAGAGSEQIRADEAILAQGASGVVAGAGDELTQATRWGGALDRLVHVAFLEHQTRKQERVGTQLLGSLKQHDGMR